MIRVNIIYNNNVSAYKDFDTQELADAYIVDVDSSKHWGEGIIFETMVAPLSFSNISPRQIRLALLSLGITEAMIDGMIDTLSSPTKEQAMIAWKYSTFFDRSQSAVAVIGALAGLDAVALDALWLGAKDL